MALPCIPAECDSERPCVIPCRWCPFRVAKFATDDEALMRAADDMQRGREAFNRIAGIDVGQPNQTKDGLENEAGDDPRPS
jgi:hypothetical protein